jgi:hypothetical protein
LSGSKTKGFFDSITQKALIKQNSGGYFPFSNVFNTGFQQNTTRSFAGLHTDQLLKIEKPADSAMKGPNDSKTQYSG